MGKGGGNMQPQQQVQATKTSDIPEIYKPYVSNVLSRAQSESNQAYIPYNAQRIAQFTPEQLQAFNMVPGAANSYTGSLADAAQSAQLSAQQFPNIDISKYMNPFVQNVVDVQKSQAQRDFDIAQAGRDAAAARSNAFGGGRAFVENSMAQDNLARLKDQIQAQGLSSAWTNAGQLFGQDRASALGASQNFQNLGAAQQGLGLGAADAIAGVGAQKQGMEQANLSQNYQDFLNQRDWNKNQINWLSSVVQGFNPQATDSTTNQTTYAAAPSTGSQFAGLGAMLLGGGKMFGLFKDGGLVGYADGGSVKGYANGKTVYGQEYPEDSPLTRTVKGWFNSPFVKQNNTARSAYSDEISKKSNEDLTALFDNPYADPIAKGEATRELNRRSLARGEETNLIPQNLPPSLSAPIDTRKDENGIGAFATPPAAPAPKPTGGIAAGAKAAPATPKTTGGINPDAKAPESAVSEGKKVSLEDYLTKSDKFSLPEDKESNALAMALITGGAQAMQTPGNFGQALGAGVQAGVKGYEDTLKGEREARKAKVDELKAVQEINLAIERGDLEKAKTKADIAKENMETPAGRLALKKAESEIDAHRATAKKATAEAEQLIPAHAEFYRKYGDVIGDKTPAEIRVVQEIMKNNPGMSFQEAYQFSKSGYKNEQMDRQAEIKMRHDAAKTVAEMETKSVGGFTNGERLFQTEQILNSGLGRPNPITKLPPVTKDGNIEGFGPVKKGEQLYYDSRTGTYHR